MIESKKKKPPAKLNKVRKDIPAEAKRRSRVDVIGMVIKNDKGKTTFNGMDIYKELEKPKK